MCGKRRVTVSGQGTVTTYGWLYKAAKIALKRAEESEAGQFFNVMEVLVFSAFTVEAYFNHLGAKRFTDWEEIERKHSKRAKLKKLAKEVGISIDYDNRPYTSLLEAFDFRDTLAHGRTETVEKSFEADFEHATSGQIMISNEWMEYCVLSNAIRVFEDITKIIELLHDAAGFGKFPFLHSHSSVYSVHEHETENDA